MTLRTHHMLMEADNRRALEDESFPFGEAPKTSISMSTLGRGLKNWESLSQPAPTRWFWNRVESQTGSAPPLPMRQVPGRLTVRGR